MNFASSITLSFNDLFSSGFSRAHQSILGLKSSLDGINGSNINAMTGNITGINTALNGINTGVITGIGTDAEITKGNVTGLVHELQGITEAMPGTTDMGIITPSVIPPSPVPTQSIPSVPPQSPVQPQSIPSVPVFDDLAEMLGTSSVSYLDGMSDSLRGIGDSFSSTVPKVSGFKSALSGLKADTINNARSAMQGMNAAMEQINQNQAMNRLAADLSVMANMTAPMRAALSDMLREPSRLAGTFESSLKNIQVVTGYTTGEMAVLQKELISIGGKAIAGPLAVADAYNDVAGGITNTAVQMGVLNASLSLAEAGQADLGIAASGLVSVMNAYGFSNLAAADAAQKAAFASDVFTQTVGMGVGSMDNFIRAMSAVTGVSAQVGVGIDELGAGMAFITAQGPSASEAGTKLKAVMTSLLNPNKTLSEALQRVGVESGSAMLKEYGLAESLGIVSQALGGSQDAMSKALGSTEALDAAMYLTRADYVQFATTFGSTMTGVTQGAQNVQLESLESKMARLQAVSTSLQLQIGNNINRIKGVFVGVETAFLQHVALPIMNSPVGSVFSNIAAGTGILAQGVLEVGSGAINTAAQLSVLAANVQNAGGYLNLLKNTVGFLGAPFKAFGTFAGKAGTGILSMGKSIIGALPAIGAYIASGWAASAAWLAVNWPIALIVVGIAALIAGAVAIVKNWDAVSGFFIGLWEKITGAFSAAWEGIKTVIVGFVDWVGGIFDGIGGWFKGVLGGDANITKTQTGVSDSVINKSVVDTKTSTAIVPQTTQPKPVLPVPVMPANQVVPTQPVQPPITETSPVIPTGITQSSPAPSQNETKSLVIPRKVGINSPVMSYTASRAFADAVSGTPVQSSPVVPAPIANQTPITPPPVQ